jgi:hypothetical protein
MRPSTRCFLLVGFGVLALGLTLGAFAYYVKGFPAFAVSITNPEEFRYVPADATVVAFANVRDVMLSDLRQRLRTALPDGQSQQDQARREFQDRTGIDVENDVDHVLACMFPGTAEPSGLILVRGRFDANRLESLARQYGGAVEVYQGKRVIAFPDQDRFAVTFLEPGLIALGDQPTLRRAIALPQAGDDISTNQGLMQLLNHVDGGSSAWAIGRFDPVASMGWLPPQIASQLSALEAFAAAGRLDGGLSASVTAEARSDEAGENLRDVLKGVVALAKMQSASRPELQRLIDSLQLDGIGKTVDLTFSVPAETLELLLKTGGGAAGSDPK